MKGAAAFFLLLALVFFPPVALFAKDVEAIMRSIRKEEGILLSIAANRRTPALYWKLMGLKLERFALVHEAENKRLIASAPETVAKRGRRSFFHRSDGLYEKIKKIALSITATWPDFRYNDEIYYTLAVMAIDRGDSDEIKREVGTYLKRGLAKAKAASPIHKKLTLKAAEHYHGLGDHAEAVRYYGRVVRFKKDKWFTKHLYNYSWSLMALGRAAEARRYIGMSLELSRRSKGSGRYVDYSENIVEHLPTFVEEGDLDGSLKTFEPLLKDRSKEFLIRVASSSKELGKYALAERLFARAQRAALDQGDSDGFFRIAIARLDFYFEIKRHERTSRFARSIASDEKNGLSRSDKKRELVERIKRHIRSLQDDGSRTHLKKVLYNFDTLKMLDPDNRQLYFFFQGEALFAQGDYGGALKYYRQSLEAIKKKKEADGKIAAKVFEAMMASLEKLNLGGGKKRPWQLYVYTNYLKVYPKSGRSRDVYRLLFNIYYREKKYKKCEDILLVYTKHYPHRDGSGKVVNGDDIRNQQFMVSQVFDHHIGAKNVDRAGFWLARLRDKKNAFDKKYIKKASLILEETIFARIKDIGGVAEQNVEYKKIYEDKTFSASIRRDAAYALASNYLGLSKSKESLVWMRRSLGVTPPKGWIGSSGAVLASVLRMISLQDFSSAADLAKFYFDRSCRLNYPLEKDFYNAAILYALTDGRHDDALEVFSKARKCSIAPEIREANLRTVIRYCVDYGHWVFFDRMYADLGRSKEDGAYFTDALSRLFWESYLLGDAKRMERALSRLNGKAAIGTRESRAIASFRALEKDVEGGYSFFLHDPKKNFDEKIFNENMQKTLSDLNTFTKRVERAMESGYPQIVVFGQRVLKRRFETVGKALLAFRPLGVDEGYRKSFGDQMKGLAGRLLDESKRRDAMIRSLVKKGDLLLAADVSGKSLLPSYFVPSWPKGAGR